MSKRRRAKITPCQHAIVPRRISCQRDTASTRHHAMGDPVQRRCRVKTTPRQDGVMSTHFFLSQNDVGLTRHRVNTISCQHSVVPSRHRAKQAASSEQELLSRRCRAKTVSSQRGAVSRRHIVQTTPSWADVVSIRRRVNMMSLQNNAV